MYRSLTNWLISDDNAPMMETDIDLNDLIFQDGKPPRSPLVIWMMDHHDDFAALIRRHSVNWPHVAERFNRAGFRATGNKPLNPETVRTYWKRARHYVARNRAAIAASSPPEPAAPVPAHTPPSGNRRGFVDIEPEIVPDDLFDKPLPTIRLRHQQPKSAIVTDAERTADEARTTLAAATARSSPPKPKG